RSRMYLVVLDLEAGRPDAALTEFQQVQRELEKVFGPLGSRTSNHEEKGYIAETFRRQGLAYLALGQVEKAVTETRRARDMLEASWKKASQTPTFRIELAACHATLARLAGMPGSGIPAADAQAEANKAMELLNTNASCYYPNPGVLTVDPAFA